MSALNDDHYALLAYLKKESKSTFQILEHPFTDRVWNSQTLQDALLELSRSELIRSIRGKMTITDKGMFALQAYERSQSFKSKMEKLEAEKLEKEIEQLQSVIDTNISVQSTNAAIQNNIPVQRNQTNISIGLGFISAIFISISVWQTCKDTTPKELKGIQKQIEESRKEVKGLREGIEGIDQSLKNMKKDSTNK